MEVCEDTVETYPPRTLYTVSVLHDIQLHLENCNQGNVSSLWAGWISIISILNIKNTNEDEILYKEYQ